MKTLQEPAVNIDEQRIATGQSETVSERKRIANRENAKKSRGPRTPRGKAYSRRNAIKHGLFTGLYTEFLLQGESREMYDHLLDGLHKQFEPIGRAEELEVERMAVCWWKLNRAWRYENSENEKSIGLGLMERKRQEKSREMHDKELETIILGLKKMLLELSAAAEVPPDLKDRFFALTSTKEEDWKRFEDWAEDELKKTESQDPAFAVDLSTPKSRRKNLAEHTLMMACGTYNLQRKSAKLSTPKINVSRHVLTNRDDLDKILRYETAIERSLDRALNRLERLQRHRMGEPVLPPVSVQLTR
jgi:hypothetical protein